MEPANNLIYLGKRPPCCCRRPPFRPPRPIPGSDIGIKASGPVPLKSTHVAVSIQNAIAQVSLTQTYKNEGTGPLECVYNFPTDQDFAVTGLTMKIGEKEIETEIMPKKKAAEKYDDAMAAGHSAAKMSYDEEQPDLLNMNLGQLQPGAEALITVRMVTRSSSTSPCQSTSSLAKTGRKRAGASGSQESSPARLS